MTEDDVDGARVGRPLAQTRPTARWLLLLLLALISSSAVWLVPRLRLNPASSGGPLSDAGQIRELLFREATNGWLRKHPPATLVVVTPDRQAFRATGQHVVAVMPAELDSYAASHRGGWVRLDLTGVTIAADGQHARAGYGTYQGWTAGGATFAFEKRDGKWYKGELLSSWVS